MDHGAWCWCALKQGLGNVVAEAQKCIVLWLGSHWDMEDDGQRSNGRRSDSWGVGEDRIAESGAM